MMGGYKMKKASMGVRFGALLLDSFFLNIINLFIFFISPYLYIIFAPFITFLYYGICEGSSLSASLGKKICGLVVVDENGQQLTSAKGFTRSICRLLSAAICGIGYFIALFDEDGKALHDKLANTFVTYATTAPKTYGTNNQARGNPSILCISGQFAGKTYIIPPQGITIGRDVNLCDITYPETTKGISRIHCKVQFNPESQMFVLHDLGSTYGTFLENGNKVTQEQPIALRSGEGFYLAARTNLFRVS